MSDTTDQPPRIDGAVITSILAAAGFLLSLGIGGAVAWAKGDFTLLIALGGVSATNMTTTVSYWLGSSSGSAKKDTLIAAKGSIP